MGAKPFGRWAAGLAACAAAMLPASVAAQSASATPPLAASVALEYTRPHQLLDVGQGRKMNIFCMGQGPVTVVFDSGGSDWSSIWALVQPAVAKTARACSYDRAGLGYSDPDPRATARFPITIVQDLRGLLKAAGIASPVVLVGHSLGGFNMKLFGALYPAEVAGLVLVDPSEERGYARAGAAVRARYGAAMAAKLELSDGPGIAGLLERYRGCAAAAAAHDLDPASDLYKRCTDPVRPAFGPEIAAERVRIQVTAAYQAAQASEIANSVYGDTRSDAAYARLFSGRPLGKKPLIVLTHGVYDAEDPDDAADFFMWNVLHDQTAALSTRGVNRVVPGSHHNIEVDRPQAIVDAVNEVLRALAPK